MQARSFEKTLVIVILVCRLLSSVTKDKWPYKQIVPFKSAGLFSLLRRGSIAYDDGKYEAAIKKIPPKDIIAERTKLLCPYQR